MHSVELLEQAIELAHRVGYGVRQEWLGGCGSGACEIGGKKWIFVDISLSANDQLDQMIEALRCDPGISMVDIPPLLSRALGVRRAA